MVSSMLPTMASLFIISEFALLLLQSSLGFASSFGGATFISTLTSSHLRHVVAEFEVQTVVVVVATRTTRSTTTTLTKMNTHQEYSAEWIDLLSPNSYQSTVTAVPSSAQSESTTTSSIPTLPGKIHPPRSGGTSFTSPDLSKVFSFAGYAEEIITSSSTSSTVERFAVNDLWEFIPYQQDNEVSKTNEWGWRKVPQKEHDEYIPGPRMVTALAVLPPFMSDKKTTLTTTGQNDHITSLPPHAILLGGWDPQSPGTGGVILDDVSMLNMNTLKWSPCVTASISEDEIATIPGGPTSRHVAVSLSIPSETEENKQQNVICLHNHRCEDHVLVLSTVDDTSTASTIGKERCTAVEWKRQPTSGAAPSSRGLHCAATIHNSQTMVIFGGAAKDGNMSNESFVLNTKTWKWTKLDCGGTSHLPSPRAGACLCTLDNDTVLLFGGAMPSSDGLMGLNDVWILNIDLERGVGRWECLIENAEDGDGERNDGALRPPGRNAAALCPIDPKKLLPRNVIWEKNGSKSALVEDDGKDSSYFLLIGGWYPFRKTFDDIFLLRISKK